MRGHSHAIVVSTRRRTVARIFRPRYAVPDPAVPQRRVIVGRRESPEEKCLRAERYERRRLARRGEFSGESCVHPPVSSHRQVSAAYVFTSLHPSWPPPTQLPKRRTSPPTVVTPGLERPRSALPGPCVTESGIVTRPTAVENAVDRPRADAAVEIGWEWPRRFGRSEVWFLEYVEAGATARGDGEEGHRLRER
jgi:hypothetical protein